MSAEDALPSKTSTSAEDRKAASALENLDAPSPSSTTVDTEAATRAMKNLSTNASSSGAGAPSSKNVKVDTADVALLVDELELSKVKATELLKSNEGDVVRAMRAFVAA